jgi:hypothetical protein
MWMTGAGSESAETTVALISSKPLLFFVQIAAPTKIAALSTALTAA